ncbi:MAG: hypothetical protein AB2L14_36725 [Candidatus Xenobiia bacterium LiM19]
MEYLFSFLIVAALLLLFMIPGNRAGFSAGAREQKPGITQMVAGTPASTPTPWSTPVTQRLSRGEIAQRLKILAESEPPKDLSRGAMCYAPKIYNPKKAEYICQKCGRKTVYPGYMDFNVSDIQNCRRYVNSITQISIKLDESEFCKKCSPAVKTPLLVLEVNYPGESKPHRCRGVSSSDIQFIQEFLEGKAVHKDSGDNETPLKLNITRIQQLLGVKAAL